VLLRDLRQGEVQRQGPDGDGEHGMGSRNFMGFFEGIYWDLLVMCWKVVGFSYFLGRDATTTGTSPTMVLRW